MRRIENVADEFRRIRAEPGRPNKALHALQWARERVAAHSLYSRADDIKPARQTSFCNDEGADVYTLESRTGRLRVELAFIPDDFCGEPDDDCSDDYASLYKYWRGPYENLGRDAAHLATLRGLKAHKEAAPDDVYVYGISVRVFYGDAADPIGEAACWGFTDDGSQASEEYRWTSALDQYREALYGVRDKIRLERRAAYQAMMREAFAANFAV